MSARVIDSPVVTSGYFLWLPMDTEVGLVFLLLTMNIFKANWQLNVQS